MIQPIKALIPCCLLCLCTSLAAQKPYFQQAVNYTIQVSLDDQKHIALGNITIEYTNHSPDTLREIWMHLWGNAFQSKQSAFTRQKLRQGRTGFYFSQENTGGGYKNLAFSQNGQIVSWKFVKGEPDIARLQLHTPLAPGQKTELATPFELKIPFSWSRLGHVGTSYQMTQWYPKPAVYDHKGWHPMPYLDQGEFYSEFGNFDVSIELPANYIVGATGVLQNPEEIRFLEQRCAETRTWLNGNLDNLRDTFPKSSTERKTLRYRAENVHDFAWFADKRFWVIRDTATLASGRTVDCWAMFPPRGAKLWQKGAFYVRRSVEFYSKLVGEYPYPHATAVLSALSAGGGMEYPMITVIGQASDPRELDDVITHEVGHNWFYGILASNEREHPFMDEGMNTYYELRYAREYYGEYKVPVDLPKILYNPKAHGGLLEGACMMLARNGYDTPPDTHSDRFSPSGYGVQSYFKTALSMHWLELSIGQETFDRAIQAYYQAWKFKHPYPEDLRASFKNAGINADWWFDAMQTKKRSDVALRKIRKTDQGFSIQVRHTEKNRAPFPITALKKGQALQTIWYPAGADKKQTVQFPIDSADAFAIDHDRVTLDLYRKNNIRRVQGLFPGIEPFTIKGFDAFERADRSVLAALPWVGWNNYDKTMLGLFLYRPPLPGNRWQYYLLPGYGTASKELVGAGWVRYSILQAGPFDRVTLGLGAKTFHFDINGSSDTSRYSSAFLTRLRYFRFAPQVQLHLKDRSTSLSHSLRFRALFIGREDEVIERDPNKFRLTMGQNGERDTIFYNAYQGNTWRRNTIFEIRYEARERKMPNPYSFEINLEAQPDYTNVFGQKGKYLKGSFTWRQQFYYKPGKKITARLFAGAFLNNTERNRPVEPVAFALNPQGFNDYRFDQTFVARTESAGILARQVSQTDGGFKAAFGSPFAGTLGNSNNYIMALNLKADLPQRLPWGIPLRPWLDIGYFDDATLIGQNRPRKEQLLWSGGLMLEFLDGKFEVYFPLVNSETLKNRYCEAGGGSNPSAIFCGGNYLKWISWSIRMPLGEPQDWFLSTFE